MAPCTFALLVVLVAFEARGEAAPIALAWEAPAECPSRESVVAAVQRLVRAVPQTPLRARARIVHERERWIAELETPSGHRALEAENCVVLADTVVVILAIAVDPDAADQVSEKPTFEEKLEKGTSPAADAPGPAVSRKAPDRGAVTRPANPSRLTEPPRVGASGVEFWSVSLSLRALFEVGMLPGPAVGGTLAARAERGIWGSELGASALLPQDGELVNDSRRGGSFFWFAGHALGCVGGRTSIPLDACAGLELGQLAGRGFGVDLPKTGRALWLGPLVTTGARLRLGSDFSLEARLGLVLPLPRPPAFGLDGIGEVHRPAVLSGRAELGIRWR